MSRIKHLRKLISQANSYKAVLEINKEKLAPDNYAQQIKEYDDYIALQEHRIGKEQSKEHKKNQVLMGFVVLLLLVGMFSVFKPAYIGFVTYANEEYANVEIGYVNEEMTIENLNVSSENLSLNISADAIMNISQNISTVENVSGNATVNMSLNTSNIIENVTVENETVEKTESNITAVETPVNETIIVRENKTMIQKPGLNESIKIVNVTTVNAPPTGSVPGIILEPNMVMTLDLNDYFVDDDELIFDVDEHENLDLILVSQTLTITSIDTGVFSVLLYVEDGINLIVSVINVSVEEFTIVEIQNATENITLSTNVSNVTLSDLSIKLDAEVYYVQEMGDKHNVKFKKGKNLVSLKGVDVKELKKVMIKKDKTVKNKNAKDLRLATDVLYMDLDIIEANLSLAKTGPVNTIVKCVDEECLTWEKTDIIFSDNGTHVSFTIDSFSGYAGAYITIIDIQSYPTVGGNWVVQFNTTGVANLTISASNGTTYGTGLPDDLEWLELKCGSDLMLPDFNGTHVFISDWNCTDIGYHTVKVHAAGMHDQKFVFGDDVGYATTASSIASDNLECLVKTSDNVLSKLPREEWTEEMFDEERRGNGKQGYIILCEDEDWNWGKLERDPKRFAIVKIPKSEFNESWLEPEYDYSKPILDEENNPTERYEIKTQRKFKLPLENFLTEKEIQDIENIKYNSAVDWSIEKDLSEVQEVEKNIAARAFAAITGNENDIADMIVHNDYNVLHVNISDVEEFKKQGSVNNIKEFTGKEELMLHGSSGTFNICVTNASEQCDYSSLASWEAGEESDLTGTGPCIANITEGFEDNDSVDLYGWTTTATDYISIFTDDASGARHDGKWDTSAYRLSVSNAAGVWFREQYVRADGLQVEVYDSDEYGPISSSSISAGGSYFRVSNSILRGDASVGNTINILAFPDGDIDAWDIYNIIVYARSDNEGNADGMYLHGSGGSPGDYNVRNIVIFGTRRGFRVVTAAKVNVHDSVIFNTTQNDWYNAASVNVIDHCADEDAGEGTNNVAESSSGGFWTDDFVDAENGDFHLLATSNLVDAGIGNGSELFSDDIEGDTRDANWDLGADEWVDSTFPAINFTGPTPANATTQAQNWFEANVTIYNASDLDVFKWNWNGTNYTIFNDSLVLMLNFDNVSALGEGTADNLTMDASSLGLNGTIVNPNVIGGNYTSGKHGLALGFDGSNDYVSINNSAHNAVDELTVTFWVYPNAFSGWSAFIGKDFWNDGSGWVMYDDGGDLIFREAGGDQIGAAWARTTGVWYFIVAKYVNSGTSRLYIDMNEIASDSISIAANDVPLTIGARNSNDGTGSTDNTDCVIDEIRIYNRSLSEDELHILYMSNLNKYDTDKWLFYINQTENASAVLDNGDYTYQVFAADTSGNWNSTEDRAITIGPLPFTVLLESPEDIYQTSSTSVNFTCNATDGVAVENLTLYTNTTGSWDAYRTSYAGEVPVGDSDLLLLFRFNNNSNLGESDTSVYDWSGNDNNGSCGGECPVYNATGRFGKAMYFDGTDDSIYVNNSLELEDVENGSGMTVMAWIYPNLQDTTGAIVGKGADGDFGWWYFRVDAWNNELDFQKDYSTGTELEADSNDVLVWNTWQHVAMTWNGSNSANGVIMYINGTEQTEGRQDGSGTKNSDLGKELNVGNDEWTGNEYNGSIDEVAIFDRVLNATEIKAIYNFTRAKYQTNFSVSGLSEGDYAWNCLGYDNESTSDWDSNRSFTVGTVTTPTTTLALSLNESSVAPDYNLIASGSFNDSSPVAGQYIQIYINDTLQTTPPNYLIQAYDTVGGQDANGATISIDFDSETKEDSEYFNHSTDSVINILEDGWYRVSYVVGFDNQLADRVNIQTWLAVNDTSLNSSRTYTYMRNNAAGFGDVGTGSTSTLLNLSTGDYVEVYAREIYTGSADDTLTIADYSGAIVEKINSDSVQIRDTTGGQDMDASPGAITFDAHDKYGSNNFTHSTSVNPEQLYINKTGWYRVSYSVSFNRTSGHRANMHTWLMKNGTIVLNSSGAYSYLRRDTTSRYNTNHMTTLQYFVDTEYIELHAERIDGVSGNAVTVPDQTWLTIEALDNNAIQVRDSTPDQTFNYTTQIAIGLDTVDKQDATNFYHDTATENSKIYVNNTGWYKISYSCSWNETNETDDTSRLNAYNWVRKNSNVNITPSHSVSYIRSDIDSAVSNGRAPYETNAVTLISQLDDGDYLELMGLIVPEASELTILAEIIANECWMTVEKLGGLVTNSTGGYSYILSAPSTAGSYTVVANTTYQSTVYTDQELLTVAESAIADCTGTDPMADSNWVISDTTICSGVDINLTAGYNLTVNGNLTINGGVLVVNNMVVASGSRFNIVDSKNTVWQNGNWTISGFVNITNSTIRMNGTADGFVGINVTPSGWLIINESSNITNGDTASAEFYFVVQAGSNFSMEDSYLSEAGWANSVNQRGLEISTTVDVFRNNTLSNNNFGLVLYSNDNLIEDSIMLSSVDAGISIQSNNNTIRRVNSSVNDFAVSVSGNNNTIEDSAFQNNIVWGIFFGSSSSNLITNSTLTNNARGIYLYSDSDYNNFTNLIIEQHDNFGIWIETDGGDPDNNSFVNNIINNTQNFHVHLGIAQNILNGTLTSATSIIGGNYIGGNYWTNSTGNGYSDNCTDVVAPIGICDNYYNLSNGTSIAVDYLPLSSPTTCTDCTSCNSAIQNANPHDIVYLSANISNHVGNCIQYNGKDNVTFDCQGNFIDGDNSAGDYGIGMNSSNGGTHNSTVRNCNVTGFAYAYDIHGSNNNYFDNLIGDGRHGNIVFAFRIGGLNNSLTNITVKSNGGGIQLSSINNLTDFYIQADWYPIELESGNGHNLTNGIIDGKGGASGLTLSGGCDNSYFGNITILNTPRAIFIDANADNNVFTNLNITSTDEAFEIATTSDGNRIYNNYINASTYLDIADGGGTNLLNTSQITATNIMGGNYIGGNYWTNSTGNGYSDNCTDVVAPIGICDNYYNLSNGTSIAVDYLPLSASSDYSLNISFISPTPDNETTQSEAYVEINVSINDSSLDEFVWNWNGTNYTIMNDSLVLFMNFDNVSALGENDTLVVDLSGQGNNGAVVGGNKTAAGVYGKGMQFDGSNDYVEKTSANSLPTNIGTISVWVNAVDFTPSSVEAFVTIYDATYEIELYTNAGSDQIGIYVDNGGFDSDVVDVDSVSSYVTNGNWHHLVGTWDSIADSHKIYIDGVERGTDTVNMPAINSIDTVKIGSYTSGENFDGRIDEVRIYNRTLTAEEVQILYMSNLNKYDTDKWSFYINQSKNATDGLDNGIYTYQAFASDGTWNWTEERTITIGPIPTPPNISFVPPTPSTGITQPETNVEINVSINTSTFEEFIWNWNGTNYTIFNDSLVLMYNFDNVSALGEDDTNIVDLSGNGNNGTTDAVVNTTDCVYGNCFTFNGANTEVTFSDLTTLSNKTWSVSLWFRPSAATSSDWVLWGGITDVSDERISIYVADTEIGVRDDYSMDLTDYSFSSDYGQWIHIVVTYDYPNSIARFYRNGTLIESDVSFNSAPSETITANLGRRDGGSYFDGNIDEVKIYNRSLSAEEVQILYMSNLNKYDTDKWSFYINQTKNATDELDNGTYTYQAFASDGAWNQTEERTITIGPIPITVSLESPADLYSTSSTTINFTCNVTDDQAVMNLTLYTNTSGSWAAHRTSYVGEAMSSDDIVLLMHFNNNSAVGEDDTYFYDWSVGNHGNCTGVACPTFVDGRYGGGFNFTTNDRILVGSSSNLNIASNITIMMWVNMNSYAESNLLHKGLNGDGYSFWTANAGSQLCFGKQWIQFTCDPGPPVGQWFHLTGTYNGTRLIIYFNGTEIDYFDISTTFTNTGTLYIGWGDDGYSDAIIDEVVIFNRTLSEYEIQGYYNYTKTSYQANFTINNISEGDYVWNCLGYDNYSNSDWDANRTFEITSSSGLTTLLEYPVDSYETNTTIINFTCNVTDDLAVTNLTLYTNTSGSWDAYRTSYVGEISGDMSDLLLLYHLNNDSTIGESDTAFNDSSGNNLNSSCGTECPVYNATGRFGKAMYFDGTNDGIYLGSPSMLDDIENGSGMTVMAWIYTYLQDDTGGIVVKGASGDSGWWMFEVDGWNSEIDFNKDYSGASDLYVESNNVLVWNTWQHVAVTWNGSNSANGVIIYINGIDQTEDRQDGAGTKVSDASKDMYIGSDIWDADEFTGTIDEVAIFDRVLNATEIQAIYNTTKTSYQANFTVTDLTSGNYKWNCLGYDNDSNSDWAVNRSFEITGAGPTAPNISFVSPTPPNDTTQSETYVEINVSINTSTLSEFVWNWNESNFTVFNGSVLAMYNLNNVSALGEDDTAFIDVSGNGNDGTCSNCPVFTTGVHGGAYDFDGENDYIITTFDLTPLDTTFALEAWVKHDGGTGQFAIIGDNNTGTNFAWQKTDAANTLRLMGGGISNADYTNTDVFDGVWHHVVLVNNGTNSYAYVDGEYRSSAATNADPSATGDMWIGARGGTTNYWNGSIDEIKIYDHVLTSAEIYELYASNLRKYDTDKWSFYINQTKNATAGLDDGTYSYQAFAYDGTWNSTEERTITIGDVPLSVSLESPADLNSTSSTSVDFTCNVTDDVAVENLTLYTNTSSSWEAVATRYTQESNIWNGLVALYHFNNESGVGENSLYVHDYSGLGNHINKTPNWDAEDEDFSTFSDWSNHSVEPYDARLDNGALKLTAGNGAGANGKASFSRNDTTYEGDSKYMIEMLVKFDDLIPYVSNQLYPSVWAANFDGSDDNYWEVAIFSDSMRNAGNWDLITGVSLENDTWYKMRFIVTFDEYVTIYINDTYYGTSGAMGYDYNLDESYYGFAVINHESSPENQTMWIDWIRASSNHLSVGPTYTDDGKFGGAYEYDGRVDFFYVGNDTSLQPDTMTVSAWVNISEDNMPWDDFMMILDTRDVNNQNGYTLFYEDSNSGSGNPDTFTFAVDEDGSGDWKIVRSDQGLALNKWTHLVGVYNGTHVSLYVNDTKQSSSIASTGITYSNAVTSIGASADQWYLINGTIDEVAVWNRSLSDSEISELYETTRTQFQANFTVSGLSAGDYEWNCLGYDNESNSDWAVNRSFTITSNTLGITLHSPQNTSTTTNTNIILNATTSGDNADANLYVYYADEIDSTETSLWIDLVALWHFNNDSSQSENDSYVYDWTGNGYDLNCTNCPDNIESRFKGGLAFEYPDSEFFQAPTMHTLNMNDFTVSVWMKIPEEAITDDMYVVSQNYYCDVVDDFWSIGPTNDPGYVGEVRWDVGDTGTIRAYSDDLINDSEWHHLVGVRNSTHVYIFMDGKLKDSTADGSMNLLNVETPVTVGGSTCSSPKYINGTIDEVAIWNRSLSAQEVLNLYDKGRWKLVSVNESLSNGANINYNLTSMPLSVQEGMVLLMHFDNDSSVGENDTHVYDWSGLGNNGTIVGADYISEGYFGGANNFTYLGSNITVPDHDSLNITSAGITVSAWIKGAGKWSISCCK